MGLNNRPRPPNDGLLIHYIKEIKMTIKQVLKETRALCRMQDCVLRTHKSFYIDSRSAYYIAERGTDRVLLSHVTLSTAHARCLDDSIRSAMAAK